MAKDCYTRIGYTTRRDDLPKGPQPEYGNLRNGNNYERPRENNNNRQDNRPQQQLPRNANPNAEPRARIGNGNNHQGRLNVINQADVKDEVDVLTGIFTVNHTSVKVLFDSGATCSFISKRIIPSLSLAEPSNLDMGIALPTGEIINCNRIHLTVPLEILGALFPSDLVEIDLRDFDIIIGMDWLTKYKARIDCSKQKISLQASKGKRLSYHAEPPRNGIKFISAIKMANLMRKGNQVYLCNVQDTRVPENPINQIPVVRDFPDVFPDEIPGMPPERDIEFTIDVVLGTEPIS